MGFTAGGLDFRGPSTADFGEEVEGGGAQFTYDADVLDGRGSVGLSVTLFSPKAWEKAKTTQDADVPPAGTSVTEVTIPGGTGRLFQSRDGAPNTTDVVLVAHLGATTLLAVTHRGRQATPGPDLNPLTDEQTFLSVLQHLRPYPQ